MLAKSGEFAGWTGQITSNSFMKREFGVPLVERFLPKMDLQLVIDTSGAYVPGHGTPTVILVGRNRRPVKSTVRTVLVMFFAVSPDESPTLGCETGPASGSWPQTRTQASTRPTSPS